eukprot:5354835-Pyramimonas_sp.AAC.1
MPLPKMRSAFFSLKGITSGSLFFATKVPNSFASAPASVCAAVAQSRYSPVQSSTVRYSPEPALARCAIAGPQLPCGRSY